MLGLCNVDRSKTKNKFRLCQRCQCGPVRSGWTWSWSFFKLNPRVSSLLPGDDATHFGLPLHWHSEWKKVALVLKWTCVTDSLGWEQLEGPLQTLHGGFSSNSELQNQIRLGEWQKISNLLTMNMHPSSYITYRRDIRRFGYEPNIQRSTQRKISIRGDR